MSHFPPCSRILTGLLALLCPVLALSQSSAGGLTQSQETRKPDDLVNGYRIITKKNRSGAGTRNREIA
jgi:hypothetical protein